MPDTNRHWPLVDDDDPHLRLGGYLALATGMYWLIAPFVALSELITEALTDIWSDDHA